MQDLAETWCAYMISRLLDRPDMTQAVLTGPLNQLKQKNLKEMTKVQKQIPRGSTNYEKVNEHAPRRDDS